MPKASPLHRFDAAVQAFISSRRALGRAVRLDEYVLRCAPADLSRTGLATGDLDVQSFEHWRRQAAATGAHNTAGRLGDDGLLVLPVPPASREPMLSASALDVRAPSTVSAADTDRADQVRRLLDFMGGRPSRAGCALSICRPASRRRADVYGVPSPRRAGMTAHGGRRRREGHRANRDNRSSTSPGGSRFPRAPFESCARYLRIRGFVCSPARARTMQLCRRRAPATPLNL